MIIEGAWDHLDSKGFLVVRSFLGEAELALLRTEYEDGLRPDAYYLGLKPLSRGARAVLDEAIDHLMAHVRHHTTLRVDAMLKGYYFAAAYVNYSWHQDFDLLAQDRVHYLNVYMPIAKPAIDKTNLSVVPFDALLAQSPSSYARLKGGGGHVFEPSGAASEGGPAYQVIDARDGRAESIDADLDRLAVTPRLSSGDMMLLRADTIHRTQDAETQRVAVSVRVVDSQATLHRSELLTHGALLRGQRLEATQLLECFRQTGRDSVTMEQFLRFAEVLAAAP